MKYRLITVALFLLSFVALSFAQQRVAYVDQNAAIKDAAELKKAEAELKKIVQSWRDTLSMLQKNYDAKYADYRKDSASLTPDSLRKRATELVNMQAQSKQYERLKINNTTGGDYIAHRNRLVEPLQKKFREAVAEVAKSEKINIVLPMNKIIATTEAIDLTQKVAAKLK